MIALGFKPASFAVATAPAIPFASILNVVASTSTNTGVAPTKATTSAVAQKVNDGHITASPGPIPIARKREHKGIGPAGAGHDVLGAAERRKLRLKSFHLRSENELAMIQDAGDCRVDSGPKPATLCGDVNERDGRQFGVQIHRRPVDYPARQPTTARGPFRCADATAVGRALRQRVAISRLATASSPVTAGAAPERTARRKASNSERNGSA